MRLIVLTENPSLLLALGSIRPDWELATANSVSELSHLAARAAAGLMDLGTTQRGLDQLERMKEAGVTLPWVVVGDAKAPEEAQVASVVKPFIVANLAEELERVAGVSPAAAPSIHAEPEIIPDDGKSPRLLRRMKAWASDNKPLPAPAKPAEQPPPSPPKPQPRWKIIEPESWKSQRTEDGWGLERTDMPAMPEAPIQPEAPIKKEEPALEIRKVSPPPEEEIVPEPAALKEEIVHLPSPPPAEDGLILPSRRGFRERFSRKPPTGQGREEKAGYELGPAGYPAAPPASPRPEVHRTPKSPRHRGNGHDPSEPEGNSLRDMINSASGAATALENLLREMPGLEDPSVIGSAIVAEVVETLAPDIVALYAASPNGTYILIASFGLTKTEERMIVQGDHPFFREIASLRQAVMVSPVDLVQGLVAGIAGARTEAFMAAPFIESGKCVAMLVVGGDLATKDLDRLMPITRDGTEGLALSLRLATLSHQAILHGA